MLEEAFFEYKNSKQKEILIMGLRESKFGEKLSSAICSALLPAVAELGFVWLWFGAFHLDNQSVWFSPYITISAALSTLLSYVIFYAILPRIKCFENCGNMKADGFK